MTTLAEAEPGAPSRTATAPVPPSPGMSPMTRPAATPITSMRSSPGSASDWRAASADSSIVALLVLVDRDVVAGGEQVDDVTLDVVVDPVGLGDPLREP